MRMVTAEVSPDAFTYYSGSHAYLCHTLTCPVYDVASQPRLSSEVEKLVVVVVVRSSRVNVCVS